MMVNRPGLVKMAAKATTGNLCWGYNNLNIPGPGPGTLCIQSH